MSKEIIARSIWEEAQSMQEDDRWKAMGFDPSREECIRLAENVIYELNKQGYNMTTNKTEELEKRMHALDDEINKLKVELDNALYVERTTDELLTPRDIYQNPEFKNLRLTVNGVNKAENIRSLFDELLNELCELCPC